MILMYSRLCCLYECPRMCVCVCVCASTRFLMQHWLTSDGKREAGVVALVMHGHAAVAGSRQPAQHMFRVLHSVCHAVWHQDPVKEAEKKGRRNGEQSTCRVRRRQTHTQTRTEGRAEHRCTCDAHSRLQLDSGEGNRRIVCFPVRACMLAACLCTPACMAMAQEC